MTEPKKSISKEPKKDAPKEPTVKAECIPPMPDNPLYIASLMSYHEKHTLGNIILSYKSEEQPIVEMLKKFSES